MTTNAPPLKQPLQDSNGGMSLLWMLFFNQLYNGDPGTTWVPTIQSLSNSGGVPSISGRVYQLSKYITFFRFTIVPVSGGNTSSTAATTYVDNFPYVMSGDGICADMTGKNGGSLGSCEQATNKIWLPSWTNVTSNVSVIGIVEAS